MTLVTLPNRPVTGDPEDISQIMADLDAVISVVNGNLGNVNFAGGDPLSVAKLVAASNDAYYLGQTAGIPTWKAAPGGAFATPFLIHTPKTSPVGVNTNSEGTATTVIGPTAGVACDGVMYLAIDISLPPMTADSALTVTILLLEDGAVLGQIDRMNFLVAYTERGRMVRIVRQPLNGSHTYTVKAYVSSGTCTFQMGTGGSLTDVAGSIVVERFS